MKKKILIIGAGIAGLSAGCYGQMNGYDTQIMEMHTLPGGLCTAWDRKGYRIDGCIHWLMGVNPASMFHQTWRELGALAGREFLTHDYIMSIENSAGQKLVMYCDIDKLEAHLLGLSPQDAELIRELAAAVRRFQDIRSASRDGSLMQYARVTMADFVLRFKDSFLREAFLAFSSREHTVFAVIFQLAIYNNRDAAWPVGGSLPFARGIEHRYLELGGRISYQSKVAEILTADGRATGIRLADGSIQTADFVISAADGYATIFQLLKGQYLDAEIQALYDSRRVSRTSIQISLGVNCDLSHYPYCTNVMLDGPVPFGGQETAQILIKHYCYDKSLCPPGKSVVTAMIYADYHFWEELYQNPAAYKAAKQAAADWFIALFERRFPEAAGQTEVVDVATPMTYYRYTHVWQGAYCGWKSPLQAIPKVLPGLAGFYLAGQWAQSTGGLPTAALTGKGSIMRVCKDDGREFVVIP